MKRRLRSLEPHHLSGLDSFCSGCMFWESASQLPRVCGSACDAEEWAAWWRRVADEWGAPGRAALEDEEVLGFAKYAPSRYFPQARTFPAPPTDPDTVLLACLHVEHDARHHGLGKVLMQAALKDLASRGVRRVEAIGVSERREPIEEQPVLTVEFLLREGFSVARPHHEYPLMRIDLRSLVSFADNLESVFDSLRFPLRAPQRVPTPYMKGDR